MNLRGRLEGEGRMGRATEMGGRAAHLFRFLCDYSTVCALVCLLCAVQNSRTILLLLLLHFLNEQLRTFDQTTDSSIRAPSFRLDSS